jgi:hypothetical protein
MKRYQKLALIAMSTLLFHSAQAQVDVQAPFNAASIPAGNQERLRVSNGFLTHRQNGLVGNFGAADQWQSIGRVQGVAQTLYGYRVQRAGRALTLGFDGPLQTGGTPTLAEAFIEWGGNNTISPQVSPGDLLIRNFTSPFSAAPVTRFRFTQAGDSYAQNGILGHLQSGVFGDIGGGSQWLGHGPARIAGVLDATIYGNRIQQGAQSMLFNLVSGKPVVGWGDQGQDMVFRYFSNRFNPSVFDDVLTLQSNGRSAFGGIYTPEAKVSISGESGERIGLDVKMKTSPLISESRAVNVIAVAGFKRNYGYYGFAQDASENYGAYGIGALGEVNFGMYGTTDPNRSGSFNYGVFGTTPSSTVAAFTAGGYFTGGLFCDALTVFSDQSIKNNVKTEGEEVTSKIMKLRPVNYFLNQNQKGYSFSNKLQHGFIAQELETVFPELVNNIQHPVMEDGKVNGYQAIKGVNYIGLISLLTRGMQEQQTTIDELKKEMQELKQAMAAVTNSKASPAAVSAENTKGYELKQNLPNPFSTSTIIYYTVPAGETNVSLAIFDLGGRMIKQIGNLSGKSQITLNANELQPGMYLYSILAGGQEIITKKMVVTK